MRYLARNTALVLATLTALVVLWQIREVVIMFVISLAIAAAVRPSVDTLVAHRWPRAIALIVTYLTGLTIFAAIVYVAAVPLLDEARQAVANFGQWYEATTAGWPQGTALERALARRLPSPDSIVKAMHGEHGLALAQALLGVTWNLFENLVRLILIIVLSMYWSVDRVHFERLWLSFLTADRRVEMREAWQSTEHGVGAYLRSEIVQATLAGLLLGVAYHALDLPYATLLATIGALAWLIPWVGALLALVPAVFVGWQVGPVGTLGAGCSALVVFMALEFFVEPRFFNRRRYNALLVALAALALASQLGLIGLLVGPPLGVMIQIFGEHWRSRSQAADAGSGFSLQTLKDRLVALEGTIDGLDNPPGPELLSILQRLRTLLDNAEQALDTPLKFPVRAT